MKELIVEGTPKTFAPREYLEHVNSTTEVINGAFIELQDGWFEDNNLFKPFGLYEWFESYFDKLPAEQKNLRVCLQDKDGHLFVFTITRNNKSKKRNQTLGRVIEAGEALTIGCDIDDMRMLVTKNNITVRSPTPHRHFMTSYVRVIENGVPTWKLKWDTVSIDNVKDVRNLAPCDLITAVTTVGQVCKWLLNANASSFMAYGQIKESHLYADLTYIPKLIAWDPQLENGQNDLLFDRLLLRINAIGDFTTPVEFSKYFERFMSAYREFDEKHKEIRNLISKKNREDSENFLNFYHTEAKDYLTELDLFVSRWIVECNSLTQAIVTLREAQ